MKKLVICSGQEELDFSELMFDEQEQRDFMNVALLNFIKETKKSCFPII